MSLNLFVANGRITKDLELRKSQSGVSNVRFTLAVNRNRKNDQGETEADFINCVAFNKTAELLVQYCGKGSKINIQGSLQTGSYEKDGQRIFTTDVMVNQIEFLESKPQQPGQVQPQQQYQQPMQQQFQQQPQYQQMRTSDLAPTFGQPQQTQQQQLNDQLPF